VSNVELVVALFTVVVALALAARRLATPLPIVLAVAGTALGVAIGLTPGTRERAIPPDAVLPVFLPPLLLAASYRVPLGAFRASLRPITLLAVGLVLVTMGAVAAVAHAVVPGIRWAAALVLGAIVAPPDPVAASAVGRRLGLENRLVTILEGEGLVNDATALVAYQVALAAAVTGHFSWGRMVMDVGLAAPLGVGVGLAIGWLTAQVRRRLDDAVLETAVSLLVPYIAYLAAERIHGSAVLAVVALGFYLRVRAGEIGAPATRLTSRTVWITADFAAGGMVFALVGVELGRAAAAQLTPTLLVDAALVAATAVAVRMAWMFAVPLAVRAVSHAPRPHFSWRTLTVLGWAGMRGVVSLALALVVPATTASGAPFPARDAVVMISLAVVFATLIGQGLTLAPLIRLLRVGDPHAPARQEHEARQMALRAGLRALHRTCAAERLDAAERQRIERSLLREMGVGRDPDTGLGPHDAAAIRAVRAALDAERRMVLRLRDGGRLDDERAARLEAEIDVDEMSLCGASGQLLGAG
jgi:Na+/H+ antiporter